MSYSYSKIDLQTQNAYALHSPSNELSEILKAYTQFTSLLVVLHWIDEYCECGKLETRRFWHRVTWIQIQTENAQQLIQQFYFSTNGERERKS